jgi:MipA family protein
MRFERVIAACLAAACGSVAAAPVEEPLWEAGIGVAAVDFPDYRGSSKSRAYLLPDPYIVYRGRFLRADRHGLRGVFFDSDRVDLNLSVGASLPVDSARDPVREGMPNLRPSVELGPSLELNLWRAAGRQASVDLRFPLRGAFTIEKRSRFIGAQFFPHLNVDVRSPAGFEGWDLGVLAGPVFTDRRYNRYFYEVPAAFATPQRPAYEPGGGFAGTEFLAALTKRYPRFWVGGFARYDTLGGARFAASPLVTSKRYFAAGIAISWIIGQSSERVPVAPDGERQR